MAAIVSQHKVIIPTQTPLATLRLSNIHRVALLQRIAIDANSSRINLDIARLAAPRFALADASDGLDRHHRP